jgi:cell division GTPase FtsZ
MSGTDQMFDEIIPGNMARIKVIGVGGGGSNAVNRMIERDITGIEFWTMNTDAQSLSHANANRRLQLGRKNLGKKLRQRSKEPIWCLSLLVWAVVLALEPRQWWLK